MTALTFNPMNIDAISNGANQATALSSSSLSGLDLVDNSGIYQCTIVSATMGQITRNGEQIRALKLKMTARHTQMENHFGRLYANVCEPGAKEDDYLFYQLIGATGCYDFGTFTQTGIVNPILSTVEQTTPWGTTEVVIPELENKELLVLLRRSWSKKTNRAYLNVLSFANISDRRVISEVRTQAPAQWFDNLAKTFVPENNPLRPMESISSQTNNAMSRAPMGMVPQGVPTQVPNTNMAPQGISNAMPQGVPQGVPQAMPNNAYAGAPQVNNMGMAPQPSVANTYMQNMAKAPNPYMQSASSNRANWGNVAPQQNAANVQQFAPNAKSDDIPF